MKTVYQRKVEMVPNIIEVQKADAENLVRIGELVSVYRERTEDVLLLATGIVTDVFPDHYTAKITRKQFDGN